MAHKYPYDDSSKALYTPAKGASFFEDWETPTDTSNHDLLCAEMSRLAYAEQHDVSTALGRVGFTLKLWIGGETTEERKRTRGTDGFIATTETALLVLALRGTESNKPEDLLADALVIPEPRTSRDGRSGGHVHAGFASAYEPVRNTIGEVLDQHRGDFLITGHSLGAGLATLAAADHASRNPELITFGSPRVGDRAFANLLPDPKRVHRFRDCCDLVTRIPPEHFDRPDIAQLFTSLLPERLGAGPLAQGVIQVIASGLASAFASQQVQYVDIGELHYHDRDGRALGPAAPDAIEEDQRRARENYPKLKIPTLEELKRPLEKAVAARGNAQQLRAAFREFGETLFQGTPVPLRDLADHAPINYVSAITGRG